LAGVMEIAHEIAANAPLAVHGCKRAIQYARDHSTQEGLEWIGMWNASMLQNDEILEAMSAAQEKRSGAFADLPSTQEGLEWIGMWNASMLQNDEILEAMSAAQEKRSGAFADLPIIRHRVG